MAWQDVKLLVWIAALRRRLRVSDGGLIGVAAAIDPLSPLVAAERWMAGHERRATAPLGPNVQDYLETATDYAELHLYRDALAILSRLDGPRTDRLPPAGRRVTATPLSVYLRGYYLHLLGEREGALESYRLGSSMPVDGVFAYRDEVARALRTGIDLLPGDWKLRYFLGTLLAARRQTKAGLRLLREAVRLRGGHSVLYRNLAEIYRADGDLRRAARWYEAAIGGAPADAALYVALDHCYAALGEHTTRRRLMQRVPAAVGREPGVVLRRALLAVHLGRPQEALELLQKNVFPPWEGWTGGREVYLLALHAVADEAERRGDHRAVFSAMERALRYPENLGTGRPAEPDQSRELVRAGGALEALGRRQAARRRFSLALRQAGRSLTSPAVFYRARALAGLGRGAAAVALLEEARTALQRVPSEATAERHYALGLVLWASGDRARAITELGHAVRLEPDHWWARRWLQRLAR